MQQVTPDRQLLDLLESSHLQYVRAVQVKRFDKAIAFYWTVEAQQDICF
jgi:hypothetical protein